MNREQLKLMCVTLGDQTLAPADRWKSIVHLKYDNNSSIPDFQIKLKKGQIQYIDKTVSVDGKATNMCGFLVLENIPHDVSNIMDSLDYHSSNRLTFVNVDWILGATFLNTAECGEVDKQTLIELIAGIPTTL